MFAFCVSVSCAVAQSLPQGWMNAPFGNYLTNYPGFAAYDAGVFTVAGSGANIYGSSQDGAHFAWTPIAGDCEIIAHVALLTDNEFHSNTRAGIMMRSSNGRGSPFFGFMIQRHNGIAYQQGVALGIDTQDGTVNSSMTRGIALVDPLPLRIIRKGDLCSAYLNTNGTWAYYMQLTRNLGEAVNAGVFVCTGNGSARPVLTNQFMSVTAHPLVAVATNAAGGFDISWVTDLPGLADGWAYTYTLQRQEEGSAAVTLAESLTDAGWTDPGVTPGVRYRYTAVAVPVPQDGLDTPAAVTLGTSAYTRIPRASGNPVTGLPSGWAAAYWSTAAATPVPRVTRNEADSTAAADLAAPQVLYRGTLNASLIVDVSGTYTFLADSCDSARLTVAGREVLNNWYTGRFLSQSAPLRLEAGRAYPVTLEYRRSTKNDTRTLSLSWNRAEDPAPLAFTPVPASAFHPVPLFWSHEDIGDTPLNGNAAFTAPGGTGEAPAYGAPFGVTLTAVGNALDTGADAAHLLYRTLPGDFEITARLDAVTGTAAARLAGLTARASTAPGAAAFSLLATPDGDSFTLAAAARAGAGAAPVLTSAAAPVSGPVWLRLTRAGTAVTAAYRASSSDWTPLGAPYVFPSDTSPAAGLIASSSGDTAATAAFGEVSATVFTPASYEASDDTFVHRQYPDTAQGAAATLLLKHQGGDSMREGFIRFKAGPLPDVRSAVLRLRVSSNPLNATTPAAAVFGMRAFPDLEWSDATATWNTPPGGLPVPSVFFPETGDPAYLGSFSAAPTGQSTDIDVTAAVRAAASSGDVTFNLFSLFNHDQSLNFHTRENGTAANRPALIVTYGAPANVRAAPGTATGAAQITWNPYPGASAYRVERAPAAEGPWAQTGADTAAERFADTGLTPGARYWYRVRAVLSDGSEATAPSAAADTVLPTAADTGTLLAAADAYLNGSTPSAGPGYINADNNFGSVNLVIKTNMGSDGYHREAILRFDGIDALNLGAAERILLSVTPQSSNPEAPNTSILPADAPLQAILLPSSDWAESTVTWNNPPPGMILPSPRLPDDGVTRVSAPCANTGQQLLIDVTPLIRTALRTQPGGSVSFSLTRLDTDGSFNFTLYSRENGTAAQRPQLLYTFGRTPPPALVLDGGAPALEWAPALGACAVSRAEAPDGPWTLLAETAAGAYTDTAAASGRTYWYTLAAPGRAPSVPLAAATPLAFTSRLPVADTTLDGNAQSTVYGASQTLACKYDPVREPFYTFDIRGLAAIPAARLRLHIANTAAANEGVYPVGYALYATNVVPWNENTVTYARPIPGYKPPTRIAGAAPNLIARFAYAFPDVGYQNNYLDADVTEAVRAAAAAGRDTLTFYLTGEAARQHSSVVAYFGAKENSLPERRPLLLTSRPLFSAPQGLYAENLPGGFALAWTAVPDAASYTVTRQGPGDDAPVIVASGLTAAAFTDLIANAPTDRDFTYTVTAVHADDTESTAAAITVTLTRGPFETRVIADTFVRDGTYATTNHGTYATIDIKRDGSDYHRETLLRFDASAIPARIATAHLRLTLDNINGAMDAANELAVLVEPDTGWVETSVTYADANPAGATPVPAPGDPAVAARVNILGAGLVPGVPCFIDITSAVRAVRAAGTPTLTLRLVTTVAGGQNNLAFRSRETADLTLIPAILTTTPQNPAPGSLMLLK
jgi:regulation of enolase protein 1 (concanavalin A-like superfamily)